MKEIGRYAVLGLAAALGGLLISDLAGHFFNGMEYGSACVLGVCLYLCFVIVVCTGVILQKLEKLAEKPQDSEPQTGPESSAPQNH